MRLSALVCLLARVSAICLALTSAPHVAVAQGSGALNDRLSFSIVAGRLTSNGFGDVYKPAEIDFTNAGFAGVVLAYQLPLSNQRWEIGVEGQINQHFGKRTFQEFVVPFTIRYSPENPWLRAFDSFAFGLGVSHATKTPRVEVERRKVSQRTLAYFFLETAFQLGNPRDSLFIRIHHRSDAYGLFEPDSGSNAYAIGWRRDF